MRYHTSDIRNSGRFKPGDEIWAYAFTYSNNKINKAGYQQPILGQLQDRNQEMQTPKRNGYQYSIIRYFVPYKKGKKELAWSKAVTLEAREYAETEHEAYLEYNRLVRLAQNWHYLSAILLNEDYIDANPNALLVTDADKDPNLEAVPYPDFLTRTATGRIPETARCHLKIRNNTCLVRPMALDHTNRIARIEIEANGQTTEIVSAYEDLARLVNFGKPMPDGTFTIYVEI